MGLEFILCPLFGQVPSPTTSTGVPSDATSPVESVERASMSPASAFSPRQLLPDLMGLRLETMPYDSCMLGVGLDGGSWPTSFQGPIEMPETLPAFGSLQSFPAYPPASFSAWQQVPEGDSQWIPDCDLLDGLHLGLAPSSQLVPPFQKDVYEICSDDEPVASLPTLPVQPFGLHLGQAWACLLEIKISSVKTRKDCLGFSTHGQVSM